MSKEVIARLYSDFKYEKTHGWSDILKTTKNIIVNSLSYKRYKQNYLILTEVTTFKVPEVDEYPIIKNKDLIPWSKTLFKVSNEKQTKQKKQKPQGLFLDKLLLTTGTTNPRSRVKNNTKCSYNLTDHVSLTTKEKSKNIFIHKHNSEKIFILRDILFHDESYSSLYYDEKRIFNQEEYHHTYINNTVEKYKNTAPENVTTMITKDYFPSKRPKTSLTSSTYVSPISSITIKSWTIEFKRVEEIPGVKPITISIPFSFLPIIYYKNFANLKYILLAAIKISNNFSTIEFDSVEWFNWIKTASEFSLKEDTSEIKTIKYNENKKPNRNSYDMYESDNVEDLYFPKKIDKLMYNTKTDTFKNITKDRNQSTVRKGNMWNRYNTYRYIWITPTVKYKVEIKWPEFNVSLKKIRVTKFMNSELMLFLLENNFKNWDFYVIHYLFSLKMFRGIIGNMLSKRPDFSEGKDKYWKTSIFKTHDINVKKVADAELISWSKVKVKEISQTEQYWQYFITEETGKINKNYLHIFHSFQVDIFNNKIHPTAEFIFNFNFAQMIIWNTIQKHQGLDDFINKIIIATKECNYIKLDYMVFESEDYKNRKTNPPGIQWGLTKPAEPERVIEKKSNFGGNNWNSNINVSVNSKTLSKKKLSRSGTFLNQSNKNWNEGWNWNWYISPEMPKVATKINNFYITIYPPYLEQIEYIPLRLSGGLSNQKSIVSDSNDDHHRNLKFEVLDTICDKKDNFWEWPNWLYILMKGPTSTLNVVSSPPKKKLVGKKNTMTIPVKSPFNFKTETNERGEIKWNSSLKGGNMHHQFKSVKTISSKDAKPKGIIY